MPKVDKLDYLQDDYTVRKFGRPIKETEFVNQLENIDVKIVSAPSPAEFKSCIAQFLGNTWNDKVQTEFSLAEQDRITDELFKGELLPAAQETISITWSVEGLDMIDTTHLIRHRAFTFAAQVHGDRDMRDDRVMVKPGIMANADFYERYKAIVNQARQLYVDMMDSGRVHGLDARTIMPRNFSHFYMVRCNIKDLIAYVKQRVDEQIQTTADNVVALKLWLEVLKLYPWLKPCIDLSAPDAFYVKQSKAGKRNIFPPNAKNDCFPWTEEQFFHPIGRDEFPGGETYLKIRKELMDQIDKI